MRKTISILLMLVIILGICACSNQETSIKEDVVGIWCYDETSFIYIYKDGTGDRYGITSQGESAHHYNSFTWEIENEYIVITSSLAGSTRVSKYTLDGNSLLDKQGKVYATKHSSDTSVDINLD